MTQGLARVEELFEARNPKVVAEISDIPGTVEVESQDKTVIVRVTANELMEEEYYFGDQFEIAVKEGQAIKPKQILNNSLNSNQPTSIVDQIIKLSSLREKGLISEEEFSNIKKELIKKLQ